METINWLWNGVTNTAESVKKRAVSVRDWIWSNKGKSYAIFATITTLIYFITLVRRYIVIYLYLINLRKRNPNNVDFPSQSPQSRNSQFRSKYFPSSLLLISPECNHITKMPNVAPTTQSISFPFLYATNSKPSSKFLPPLNFVLQ